jgi:hypothetical protein
LLLLPGLLKELVPWAWPPPSCGPLPLPDMQRSAAALAAWKAPATSPSRAWSSGPCSGGAVFPGAGAGAGAGAGGVSSPDGRRMSVGAGSLGTKSWAQFASTREP